MYKKNPKLLNQFQYCEREGVPFIVTVGDAEREKGGVTLRNVDTRQEVGVNPFLFHFQSTQTLH
jgi:histidyl-tRNA synthetase